MATSKSYIDFVCEQVRDTGTVRSRKMFGEYMVYINDKPILLVCDNTVYVKERPEIAGLLTERGTPYAGAKEHFILDIENRPLFERVIGILEPITPLPRKKHSPSP